MMNDPIIQVHQVDELSIQTRLPVRETIIEVIDEKLVLRSAAATVDPGSLSLARLITFSR